MIKLCLIDGVYSSLDGNLDLNRLLMDKQDYVILSCDEFRPAIVRLENDSAAYISSFLPMGCRARWDESEESFRNQKVDPRFTNPRISELKFRLILEKDK